MCCSGLNGLYQQFMIRYGDAAPNLASSTTYNDYSEAALPLELEQHHILQVSLAVVYTLKYAHNSRKLHTNAHLVSLKNRCEDCSRAAARCVTLKPVPCARLWDD